ncbi:AmmeMemoRadiSam system protein B [Marinobacter hydrocarbonoclasticus]|nr:AmmeMemoRadiSam system protein B [Marinobacter nauticus]
MRIRPAAVAGYFYPGEASELARDLDLLLSQPTPVLPGVPKGLIVPHAGYLYSGAIAARAYLTLTEGDYRRVILLGPAHTKAVRGIALPEWSHYQTPLGRVALDTEALQALDGHHQAHFDDVAHAREHALEVQLPFIQVRLPDALLLPMVVGAIDARTLAECLSQLLTEQDLLLISSDMSHFLSEAEAEERDQHTIERILALKDDLLGEEACGAYPINGALRWAQSHGLSAHLIGRSNSARATGDHDRVVGYAAFAFC